MGPVVQSIEVSAPESRHDHFGLFAYTTYLLRVQLADGRTCGARRRYRDFDFLTRELLKRYAGLLCPPLPGKQAFGRTRIPFVQQRMRGLQLFFARLAAHPTLARDSLLHSLLSVPGAPSWEQSVRMVAAETRVENGGLEHWDAQLGACEPCTDGEQVALLLTAVGKELDEAERVLRSVVHATAMVVGASRSFGAALGGLRVACKSWENTERVHLIKHLSSAGSSHGAALAASAAAGGAGGAGSTAPATPRELSRPVDPMVSLLECLGQQLGAEERLLRLCPAAVHHLLADALAFEQRQLGSMRAALERRARAAAAVTDARRAAETAQLKGEEAAATERRRAEAATALERMDRALLHLELPRAARHRVQTMYVVTAQLAALRQAAARRAEVSAAAFFAQCAHLGATPAAAAAASGAVAHPAADDADALRSGALAELRALGIETEALEPPPPSAVLAAGGAVPPGLTRTSSGSGTAHTRHSGGKRRARHAASSASSGDAEMLSSAAYAAHASPAASVVAVEARPERAHGRRSSHSAGPGKGSGSRRESLREHAVEHAHTPPAASAAAEPPPASPLPPPPPPPPPVAVPSPARRPSAAPPSVAAQAAAAASRRSSVTKLADDVDSVKRGPASLALSAATTDELGSAFGTSASSSPTPSTAGALHGVFPSSSASVVVPAPTVASGSAHAAQSPASCASPAPGAGSARRESSQGDLFSAIAARRRALLIDDDNAAD